MSEDRFVFKVVNKNASRMELSGTISESAKDAIIKILTTADRGLLGKAIREEEFKKLQALRKLAEGKKDE